MSTNWLVGGYRVRLQLKMSLKDSISTFILFVFSVISALEYNCTNEPIRTIKLNNINGNDTEECLSGVSPCKTLKYVFDNVGSKFNLTTYNCFKMVFVPTDQPYEFECSEINLPVRNSLVIVSDSISENHALVNCICPDYDENIEANLERMNMTASLRITGSSFDSVVTMQRISFEGCLRPIRFEALGKLTISDCKFMKFSASAIDIHNIMNVAVVNSVFEDSYTVNISSKYRGNAGGLSLRYSDMNATNVIALVSNCHFKNNTAGEGEVDQSSTTSDIFGSSSRSMAFGGSFFGRGGGLGVFIDSVGSIPTVSLTIEHSHFIKNKALAIGAGIYAAYFGRNVGHETVINNCTIMENEARDLAGGLLVSFNSYLNTSNVTVQVKNSQFINNRARMAGGAAVFNSYPLGFRTSVSFDHCNFEGNRANKAPALLYASQSRLLESQAMNWKIQNCNFNNNIGDGVFSSEYVNTEFQGKVAFKRNQGIATEISASKLLLKGSIIYSENKVQTLRGGAMSFTSLGQLQLSNNSFLSFYNNTGRIGASIAVEVQSYSKQPKIRRNPQCFLQYEDSSLPPDQWSNVTIKIDNNKALIGSAIHSSFLDPCSWFSDDVSSSVFDIEQFRNWTVFDVSPNNSNSDQTSSSTFIQTEASQLRVKMEPAEVWPGKIVTISLDFKDQYGNPTYAFPEIHSTFTVSEEIMSDPAVTVLRPNENMTTVQFLVSPSLVSRLEKRERINVTFKIILSQEVIQLVQPEYFNITLVGCPQGFYFGNANNVLQKCTCITDSDNTESASIDDVLDCNYTDGKINITDGYWVGGHVNRSQLVLFPCPQPHCICKRFNSLSCNVVFDPDDTNSVCYNNRTGVLCGRCNNDSEYGVGVLTTHCYKPVDYGYLLFIPLIVLQVVTITLIILLGVRILSVLKGLLFYMQVAPYLTEFFPIDFWKPKQYLHYFSSLVGLYFPWDFSMYPDMPALVSFAMRYEILTVTAITSTVIMAISFKFKFRSRYWSGLWTLILLTSGLTLYTSFGLLNCVSLPLSEGQSIRWYYDGEQVCFTNGHIPLAVLAIAVLLAYAVFTIVLFVYTLRPSLKRSARFNDFLSAVHCGYRKGREWYGPYELVRRFIVLLFVVAMPGVSAFPVGIVLILFLVHMYTWPYNYWWQNAVETMIFSSLLLLLLIRLTAFTPGVLEMSNNAAVSVSVPSIDRNRTAENLDDVTPGILTSVLLFWYYLPIALVLLATLVVGIYRLWKGPFGAKVKSLTDHEDFERSHQEQDKMKENVEMVSFTIVGREN